MLSVSYTPINRFYKITFISVIVGFTFLKFANLTYCAVSIYNI